MKKVQCSVSNTVKGITAVIPDECPIDRKFCLVVDTYRSKDGEPKCVDRCVFCEEFYRMADINAFSVI